MNFLFFKGTLAPNIHTIYAVHFHIFISTMNNELNLLVHTQYTEK